MIDKQFDDILKRKLNNMTEASNSDWSAFERKLDDAQSSNGTAEGDFDNAVKQKLAGITATNISSDWSTFEHILDEDQLTDDLLDDKVSQEMNNMRAPYRQDHWELLHNTLEYQKQRNNSIIGYKVIELSLLLILLLTANNFYKYLPSTFEVEKPMIYASIEDKRPDDSAKSVSANSITATTSTKAEASIKNISTGISDNPEIISSSSIFDNTNTQSNSSAAPFRTTQVADATLILSNMESSNDPHEVISEYAAITSTNLFSSPLIATLDMSSVPSQKSNMLSSIEKSAGLPIKVIPANKTEKSIFLYAGLDNNLVNSPFDDIYDTEGFRTYGIGYSAGVEFGFKKGKKDFTLGLGYSNRAYEPRIIEELTGNPALTLYETSLDHIEFNIMSLSAGLKYMLVETDNWGLDFGIGASANIVVSSDYSIETRTIQDGKFVSSRGGRKPSSNLDDKPLHDGIFENGSLKENIYFTTDVSFGLHRKLSEKSTFILRPEYSLHSFSDGIGPNNDLINNLSLNLGVRYRL